VSARGADDGRLSHRGRVRLAAGGVARLDRARLARRPDARFGWAIGLGPVRFRRSVRPQSPPRRGKEKPPADRNPPVVFNPAEDWLVLDQDEELRIGPEVLRIGDLETSPNLTLRLRWEVGVLEVLVRHQLVLLVRTRERDLRDLTAIDGGERRRIE